MKHNKVYVRIAEDDNFGTASIEPRSSNLDEAAEEYAPDFSNDFASKAAVEAVRNAFKAGAEWMAGQSTKVVGFLL